MSEAGRLSDADSGTYEVGSELARPDSTVYREHDSDLIRAPQQGDPEGIFTWVRLPDGKIRLYASRELADTAWGQRDHLRRGVLWHLDANLDHVLVVDRDTPAEALTWVLQRWVREDTEKAAEQRELSERNDRLTGAQPDRKQLR